MKSGESCITFNRNESALNHCSQEVHKIINLERLLSSLFCKWYSIKCTFREDVPFGFPSSSTYPSRHLFITNYQLPLQNHGVTERDWLHTHCAAERLLWEQFTLGPFLTFDVYKPTLVTLDQQLPVTTWLKLPVTLLEPIVWCKMIKTSEAKKFHYPKISGKNICIGYSYGIV